MRDRWIRKPGNEHFLYISGTDERTVPLLQSPLLHAVPGIRHGFTTRAGGVSEGFLSTLNFSFKLEGDPERTLENFRRAAATFHVTPDRVVLSDQVHGDRIRVVTEADAGKGVTREKDYEGIDALVTNEPELLLTVVTADCVPILFADPEKRVIAAAHSGWRGTAKRIGEKTVRKMTEVFGCAPEDITAVIGPSICRDCYEVGADVAEVFQEQYKERAEELPMKAVPGTGPEPKYLLDLWELNRLILLDSGILPSHISVTDICTACNSERLFSHRATGGKRGLSAAMILLES